MNIGPLSALIIVDMVHSDSRTLRRLANRIATYAYQTEDIKFIIVHTSGEPGLDHTQLKKYRESNYDGVPFLKERPVWHNSNKLYTSANNIDLENEWAFMNNYKTYFREHDEQFSAMQKNGNLPFTRPQRAGLVGTNPTILNMKIRDDQAIIGCWSLLQLKYITETYSKQKYNQPINNIVYAGGSLDICLKDRVVGYSNIANANKNNYFLEEKNILAKSELIYNTTGEITTEKSYPTHQWDQIDKDTYKLIS